MKNRSQIVLMLCLSFFSSAVFANSFSFHAILESPRGPFGPHELQSANERVDGNGSPVGYYFKSAFRTAEARELAARENIYLGNLFTTNYYELTGEVLNGDAHSNHAVDHIDLLRHAKAANPRAVIMARNWIMEKYYLRLHPASNLSRVFALRSISDYESERAYAVYFFDVYLAGLTSELQFLLSSLLVRESPISETASIGEARDLISNTYLRQGQRWGSQDPKTLKLYAIRNLVHNHMSRDAISELTRFLDETPEYANEGNYEVQRVREILEQYYAYDGSELLTIARDIGAADIVSATTLLLATNKSSAEYQEHLLRLSQLVADLKWRLVRNDGFPYLRTKALLLITTAAQFISKEATTVRPATSDTVRIFLNCLYSEGFLIRDNWTYFQSEITNAADATQIIRLISDIADVSATTLAQAMRPTADAWIALEPSLANFNDTIVKSSSLNALSVFSQRFK